MTERRNFTQLGIERLVPPASGRVTYWDRNLPGFGLRIGAPRPGKHEGRKTWIVMGRVDGKPVMVTIGTLAQVPKLDNARKAAREAIRKMQEGTNPLVERKAEKALRAAEAEAAAAAAREAAEGQFAAVAARFLATNGIGHPSRRRPWAPKYATEFRRILEHDVLPRWGTRPIRLITKHDVNELLDAKARTRERPRKGTNGGAGVQANRTLTRLKTLFMWAQDQELVDRNPVVGVLLRGEERARDRVLTESDIVTFWSGTDQVDWRAGAILKLLLLTAQREGEVAGMRRGELDLEKRTWTIPRERTKSRRAHVVHLSELAAEIIDDLPEFDGDLVFPTRNDTPFNNWKEVKERLDTAMGVTDWIIHDLRRTATTIMAEHLKVAPHVADKILNHSAGAISGVAAIYNRSAYLDERKAALEALGRWISDLVRPGGSAKVVRLRA
jgi:integrase